MLQNIFIFISSLILIIKGATSSTEYSFEIAQKLKISKYIVGFIIIAIISIVPETLVSINTAIQGVPSLGLGTLFGSNVADLTLVFAIIIFITNRSVKIESKLLSNNLLYPFFLMLPIVLGLDGVYTRIDGIVLVLLGIIFYYFSFKKNSKKQDELLDKQIVEDFTKENINNKTSLKNNIKNLLFSMLLLLVGSHFIVSSAISIAVALNVSSIIIGILILGIGTTIPELSFCLASVREKHDSLAVGDILGTVLADATLVLGMLIIIRPFTFPLKIIYLTGFFMVISTFILFYFMRTGKNISKKEAIILVCFWVIFIFTEIIMSLN